MLERSSIGVLGVLAAGLSLAALAAQPQPPAVPRSARAQVAAAPPSAPVLRALRDGARVEINAARAADLELLPGIGPTLARRIIEHRDAHGAFDSAEDLLRVHGIGPRTLERLRPLLAFAHSSKTNTTDAATAK